MEGKFSNSEAANLLRKIKELIRSVVEDLSKGRSPTISINRFRSYCMNPEANCLCSSDEPKGREVLTLKRESHVYRIDMLLRLLLIIQKLLQENRHASKRDIYYMHPSVFTAQSVVDRAISDICILLQCSRHNLNVVSVANGLVMGWLRFNEAGRKFDGLSSPNTAFPIPILVEEVKDIVSIAEYILVVEKESVFQRLANDEFCKINCCIAITGRGYPDVPTRRFLRLLIEKLYLPVYCLVDCDPYGFEILTTYRFGSMQMAYDREFLRAPEIQWIGAFPSDSEKYGIPPQCLLPLTEEDMRRIEAMLLRCYLRREMPQWRSELELMLQSGLKFEIEALSVHSLSFLSEVYIPSKVQEIFFPTEKSFAPMDFTVEMVRTVMSCVMKVNKNCELCRRKVTEVLHCLHGVYSVDFVGEEDSVKLKGRVNPNVMLAVLERYGEHGKVTNLRFDGEVITVRSHGYYGETGYYHPYGPRGYAYPLYPPPENPPRRRSQHTAPPLPPLPPPPPRPFSSYLHMEPPSWPTSSSGKCCTIL